MRRSLSLAVLLALAATSASAQAGRYTVDGTTPGGSGTYGGTVDIAAQGEAFRVVWNTGGDPVEGIGVVVDDVFAVAYGGACGVVAYETVGDGAYEAVWATMGGTALGTERAERTGREGTYRVAGTNPGSDDVYTGTLTMAAAGNATQVHWNVGGSGYDGIGLSSADGVFGIAYGAETCGVAVYRMDGGALDGVWTVPGADGVGTERLQP